MGLNFPHHSPQCSFVWTIGNRERHFVKVFCVDGRLRGLERGTESGFRCHGHAITMVTTHSTFLQPCLNKGAFEKVFIWTKSKHFLHCVCEFSLDRCSRRCEFQPQGKAGQRCAGLTEPLLSLVNGRSLWKTHLLSLPSQFGVQPFLPPHGDSASTQPPPDRHSPSRHRLSGYQTGAPQW